ncbi:deoxyribose-phosphate aldolase [Infundibulicybe gibba]|nr:deoxyribose-phosphate aldolase [Infundibulicybe gibba]
MENLPNEEWASLIESKISAITTSQSVQDPETRQNTISSPLDAGFPLTVDHTLLKPDATPQQIDDLCDQALRYKFKSCCVNGANVRQVASRLHGSTSVACCVIGFPLGAGTTKAKAFEAQQAVEDGAQEIDMVINIGALKAADYALVYKDIRAVVDASSDHTVKVILETVFLSDNEKIAASFVAAEAGAAFVKTCTGFSGGSATAADVALMKRAVAHRDVKVKASAGIRSFEACHEMLNAGAERIGTSSGVAIMESKLGNANY